MVFWRDVDETALRNAVSHAKTKTEAIANLGFSGIAGSHYKILDMLVRKYGVDTHFDIDLPGNLPSGPAGKFKGRPLVEICVMDSTYTSTTGLKRRLLKEGVLERKCYMCGLTHWMGDIAPIGALRLDHINGIGTDNRFENLRLLCGICDAITPTYCGRNKRLTYRKPRPPKPCVRCKKRQRFEDWKHCMECLEYFRENRVPVQRTSRRRRERDRQACPYCDKKFIPTHTVQKHCSRSCATLASRIAVRPDKDSLLDLLSIHSWSAVGRMYGVSCNAIRKWVRGFGVDPKSINPPRNPNPARRPDEKAPCSEAGSHPT